MNILVYFPTNKRSVSIESVLEQFVQQGHQVFLGGWDEPGDMQEEVKKFGVKIHTFRVRKRNSLQFYLAHIFQLVRFVRKHKIDIVYSHIQQPNLVAVFAEKFSSARFIICRHHSDCGELDVNRREVMADKIINALAKTFVVPSIKVYKQMTEKEGVNPSKIHLIHYGYRFGNYPKPSQGCIREIRQQHPARHLLVSVARLIPEKRHLITFRAVQRLSAEFDLQLLILGEGPMEQELKKWIAENGMQDKIHLLGFRTDVMDYLSAADLLVHMSASEASNSVIKEAGWLKKPVIACRGVGDFSDYIEHGISGMLLDQDAPEKELDQVIRKFLSGEIDGVSMGEALKERVTNMFSIEEVIRKYDVFDTDRA